MKKIIILGSNSFSGVTFCKKLLEKKYYVIGISRSKFPRKEYAPFPQNKKNFKFFSLDLNKNQNSIINIIKKNKPSFIINFISQSMVGESWASPQDWFYTNSYSIPKFYFELSKLKFKFRLVHISTPEVYGSISNSKKETAFYNPNTPYASSRTTGDFFLKNLYANNKIDFVATRAANVYGEYQKLYRLIPKVIYCIINKKKFPLQGNGLSKRSFIHIDDVFEATFLLMMKKKFQRNDNRFYNISTKKIISVIDIIKIICKIFDVNLKNLIFQKKDRIGKDNKYELNSRKIRDLGWSEKVSLEEGLNRTIKWVRLNNNSFNSKDLKYEHQK